MSYETFWEEKGIRWVFTGILTSEDLLRSNLELYEDERFDTIEYELADFTGIESYAATAETIRRVARMDRDQSVRNPELKVALIATKDVHRGLAQVYALSGGDTPWSIGVFETEEEARVWLAGRQEEP